MSLFHKRICYDKDENYKIVSDNLYKNGIFDDNDNEIANNIYRKVTILDENKQNKNKKKNIDEEYRTTLINFGQSKYFTINFAMAKLMEMEQTDRNKVALYLFNNIKI